MTLSPEEIQHRKDFLHFVRNLSEPWYRSQLTRLYNDWEEWNKTFFFGAMTPPYMLLTDMQGARTMGDCSNISGFGGKSQIRLRRTILTGQFGVMKKGTQDPEGCYQVLADTLLHEMIHQYLQEVELVDEQKFKGHGPVFRDHCNRIGKSLSFLEVRCSNQKSQAEKDKPLCAYWPHREDAETYYLGAFPDRITFGERAKTQKGNFEDPNTDIGIDEESPQAAENQKEENQSEAVKPDAVKALLEEGKEVLSPENFLVLARLARGQS